MEGKKLGPIFVYCKTANDKKFGALSSLAKMEYACSLMYAVRIPVAKLERLKEWRESVMAMAISKKLGLEIQFRQNGVKGHL